MKSLAPAILAGLVALAAAYLIGGRYVVIANGNAIAVADRFTGAIYVNGTSLHIQPSTRRE